MRRVLKYTVPYFRSFSVEMPKGAKILSVQDQDGEAFMYAICDPEAELERRWFIAYGTGQEILGSDDNGSIKYIATYQLRDGKVTYHLFEHFGDEK